jgi:hypothetical protein
VTRSRLTVVVLLGVLGLALVLVVVRHGDRPPGREAPAVPVAAGRVVGVPAADVLRAWDEQRAAAYAAGSVRQLRQLYVGGSAAARSDVRMLQAYLERGLVVEGMRTQVLALRVVEERPGRLRLEVTDRLTGASAVGSGRRVPLPRDQPDTRRVTLLRGGDGAWRVSVVLPVR